MTQIWWKWCWDFFKRRLRVSDFPQTHFISILFKYLSNYGLMTSCSGQFWEIDIYRAASRLKQHLVLVFIPKQKRHSAPNSKAGQRKGTFCLLNERGTNCLLSREPNKRNLAPIVSFAPLKQEVKTQRILGLKNVSSSTLSIIRARFVTSALSIHFSSSI